MSLREAAERLLERWESQQDMDTKAGEALFDALRAALAESAMAEAEAPKAEAPNPWKEALLARLVNLWVVTEEHETNPRKAVADLIAGEVRIALDPAVSSDAQALIDRGKAEAPNAEPVESAEAELSDEEIINLWTADDVPMKVILDFGRAVLAHGRKKENATD